MSASNRIESQNTILVVKSAIQRPPRTDGMFGRIISGWIMKKKGVMVLHTTGYSDGL